MKFVFTFEDPKTGKAETHVVELANLEDAMRDFVNWYDDNPEHVYRAQIRSIVVQGDGFAPWN